LLNYISMTPPTRLKIELMRSTQTMIKKGIRPCYCYRLNGNA
jgi:hypothetical protein